MLVIETTNSGKVDYIRKFDRSVALYSCRKAADKFINTVCNDLRQDRSKFKVILEPEDQTARYQRG